ncbi:MAG: glycosyltransferase family 2 protein [Jejuia sp.]
MNLKTLASIIIPTFNRAHLIVETLESILNQTYSNWECIVVDDNSEDDTDNVLRKFINNDTRFKYFKRPVNRHKGANACRNYGLELSQGDVIIFFDSDDLMTAEHVELKVNNIIHHNVDYVITRTQYFNAENTEIDKNYKFHLNGITVENYITQKVNWLTLDVAIISDLAKKISFNEQLQSGQEYNYFCKLVLHSVNAKFIDKVVSLRRSHEGSIRAKIDSKDKFYSSQFNKLWYTYYDTKHMVVKSLKLHWMRTCVNYVYDLKKIPTTSKQKFYQAVFNEFGTRGFYFVIMMGCLKIFGKGYIFKRLLFK